MRALPLGRNRTRSPQALTRIAGSSTEVPFGLTARSGLSPATSGPAYTIRLPSGDHTGFNVRPATRRTGAPPSAGILNNTGPAASSPPVTIHFPSGDQQAVPRTSRA